jgi:uncharacterized protein YjbI with pentapeptide repeats
VVPFGHDADVRRQVVVRGAAVAALVAVVGWGAGTAAAGGAGCAEGSGADFQGRRVTAADVPFGTDLECANLRDADLSGLDLTQKDLTGAQAQGADFRDARLIQATLEDGDFSGANFTDADMGQVSADGADFSGADFSDADLTQATLTDTDLSNADMGGAQLIQADLDGANLDGVRGVTGYAIYVFYGSLVLGALLLLSSIRRAFKPVVPGRTGFYGTGMLGLYGQPGYVQQQFVPPVQYAQPQYAQPQYAQPQPYDPMNPPPLGDPGPMGAPPPMGAGLGPPPPPPPMMGAGLAPGGIGVGGYSAPAMTVPTIVGPQPRRRVGVRLVCGIIGTIVAVLGIHMFAGALLGEVGGAINPLASQCSGVHCKVGVDLGIPALTYAPFVAIAGFVIRSRG